MYEYSVRSSDNNGWGIDGKIENAGEQTVLRVEIGEKTDIRIPFDSSKEWRQICTA